MDKKSDGIYRKPQGKPNNGARSSSNNRYRSNIGATKSGWKAYWSYVRKREEEIEKALKIKSRSSTFPCFSKEIFIERSRRESSHVVPKEK